MDLRNNLHDQILRKCSHLRPVLNIRTKLDLYTRISYTLAVKYTIVINCLIKEIFLSCITTRIILCWSQETFVCCSCRNRTCVHKCNRRNLAILDFGTFAVREVSGRMTDTECIICRSIPCTKARSAKSSLHNSSRFKKSCQNAILSQFHINRSTCRIYTQCEGICTNALAFKDISCCTDIFKSTTCTSCDNSLFYIKFTINYFVS